jgi:hypothetical protein
VKWTFVSCTKICTLCSGFAQKTIDRQREAIMNWDAIGAIGEVVGAFAVVATLFYLTSQIRQNTNALKAESRRAVLDGGQAELFAMVEDPGIVVNILKPEPLTAEEQISLCAYLFATVRTREFAWGRFKEGAIDAGQWATEINVIKFIFDTDRTRHWWEQLGRNTYGPDFAAFVDNILDSHEATNTLWQGYAQWNNQSS